MAERGQRTKVTIGGVSAEVSLIKTDAKPREAQHQVRTVVVHPPNAETATVEVTKEPLGQDARGAVREAVESLGPIRVANDLVHDPLGPPEPEPVPAPPAPADVFGPTPEQAAALGGIAGGVLDGTYDPGGPPSDRQRAGDELAAAIAGEPPAAPEPEPEVPAELVPVAKAEVKHLHGVWREEEGQEPVWVDLTDELADIDLRTRVDGQEVAACIAQSSIPAGRVRDSWYVAPAGKGAPKVLALLWSALRKHRVGALVRWTKRTNQALGVVVARGTEKKPHLELMELTFSAHVKPLPDRCDLGAALAATTDVERAAAERLVAAYREKPSVVDVLRDERSAQRAEVLQAAREGRELPAAPAARELPADAYALAELLAR